MSFIPCNTFCNVVGFDYKINNLQAKSIIYTKDHKTGYLFDPWVHLGPKKTKTHGTVMG